jgi:hypothetical protein
LPARILRERVQPLGGRTRKLRHLDAGRRKADAVALVDYLCSVAQQQSIFFLWRPLRLPESVHRKLTELAKAEAFRSISCWAPPPPRSSRR